MHAPTHLSATSCLAFAAAIAAASVTFAPPVLAGDLDLPPERIAVRSWTGFYGGLHGGWGWGRTEVRDPLFNPTLNPTETKYNGPLVGAQVGVNWQLANVVVGAELDGSWAFVRGNTSRNPAIITSSTNNGMGYKALATGTARVGYAMDQWLFYAKGGVAWADMEITTQIAPLPTTYHRSLIGAVGGAGVEVAFLRNVSAKVEYNLIYLPTDHLEYVTVGTNSSLDHLAQLIKFGINVRLGGDAAVTR